MRLIRSASDLEASISKCVQFGMHLIQKVSNLKCVQSVAHQFLNASDPVRVQFRTGPIRNVSYSERVCHCHFVQKKIIKKNKKIVTRDMWDVTRDTWHVTRDTRHVTRDTFGGVNILSKFQLPSSYRLWFMILWRSGGKGSVTELMNQWRGCL